MIHDGASLLLFAGAPLALVVVPRPAVLYIAAQRVHRGRAGGRVSMLGIQAAGLVHVAAGRYVSETVFVGFGVATALRGWGRSG